MAKQKTTPPKRSIFSIDPKTNKPFIEYEDAHMLVAAKIYKSGKNILEFMSFEDIMQEIFLRLCINEYDPTKSKPSTFIYMVANSGFSQLFNYKYRSKDRWKEASDFVIGKTDDGFDVMATDCNNKPDHTTPEDHLNLLDTLSELDFDFELIECDKPPKGFRRQMQKSSDKKQSKA